MPFGAKSIITLGDLDWLAGKLTVFDPKSPEEITSAVQSLGLDIDERQDNKFVLSCGILRMQVSQADGKTNLLFLPNDDLKLNTEGLYKLFFQDLPDSVYADLGTAVPTPEFVQNSTIVFLKTDPSLPRKMNLRLPYHKEYFEKLMEEDHHEIISVKMAIESEDMVAFSITLPNLEKGYGDVEFSFSSRDIITAETMEILLRFQGLDTQSKGDKNVYARNFARAVNSIREGFRT